MADPVLDRSVHVDKKLTRMDAYVECTGQTWDAAVISLSGSVWSVTSDADTSTDLTCLADYFTTGLPVSYVKDIIVDERYRRVK